MTTYFLNILQGLLVTLGVSLGALVVAALLGLAGAAAKLSHHKWLNWVGDIYSTVIRGVPDLVWMLLLYFGGQILVNDIAEALGFRSGPQINPFVAGVLTIGFVYGAYMTETFRGAIMSVPKGQSEAGWAFGMSRFYTFRRMVLPQMVRFALPSFTNNWLVLLKATALVSVIGLADITGAEVVALKVIPRYPQTYFEAVRLLEVVDGEGAEREHRRVEHHAQRHDGPVRRWRQREPAGPGSAVRRRPAAATSAAQGCPSCRSQASPASGPARPRPSLV